MRVAIIPARGGSKRIPRKNIKLFCGQPIIAWTIKAALNSECFDRVIVSTDDHEIADTARKYGAEAPFVRPSELANDYVGTIPVVRHAIEWLHADGCISEEVCCLYATAPLILIEDLRQGLVTLKEYECDYAFSVTDYAFPIQRAIRLDSEGKIEMVCPENFKIRSQDLERAYHDAGQFYWGRAKAWLEEKKIFSSSSKPIILPRYRVQDIDTHDDWKRAELIFTSLNGGS